ncbi:WD domain, G-beta repeat-containing protein [Besnoitia besnoiti]|uniref:WD domain, G-beta repeat-containing protein n=1 Tax=Besnoitia besnoiti TaxID=94643 RepID=A0A2A9M4B3_BESBE|nr:WD domain, G-beta repeat-containing protein [Besnoitia besnoiti]PFH32805.1 WD domain, G-beta repeat-containing protein [Besnoitia besnoiti]
MAIPYPLSQDPYVNVLKAFPLHDEEACKRQGDVSEETTYMQIRALKARYFVIHIDITTVEGLTVRATFSNMVKEPKAVRMMGASNGAKHRRRHALWAGRDRMLVAQASTLVCVNTETGTQKCLFGHTAPIDLIEVSSNFAMAATVQNDRASTPAPQIRIWNLSDKAPFCAAVLQCPSLDELRVFRFDTHCRRMVVAGIDAQKRQQLQIWDMSRLRSERRCNLLARQVSDFDVACIRFSPFDEFCLLSCGSENIRFWRIKNSHLPGCSVVLEAAARANCYTDLDFECCRSFQSVYNSGEKLPVAARIFVSSTAGCVAQVDYVTRQLQRVYKLHTGPIWSLTVSDAFCTTASEDGFFRVWPLTFQSCFMHMRNHEAPAVGVDASEDGLQLLCASADGSVGVVNLSSQQHHPLLRTHATPIRDAAAFEFQSSVDQPTRVACHPLERILAVGFDSGALRVFDIDAKPPQVLLEARHHLHAIRGLHFVRNAGRAHRESVVEQSRSLLVTCDSAGVISVHDEQLEYQLVQRIENPGVHQPPEGLPPLVFSPDGHLMARYFDSRRLCCFAFPSLLYKAKVCLPRSASRPSACSLSATPYTAPAHLGRVDGVVRITAYGFASSGQGILVVCSSDSKMRIYDLSEADDPDRYGDTSFDDECATQPGWSPRSVASGSTRSRSCGRGSHSARVVTLSGRPATGWSDASVPSRSLTCLREIPLMSGAITVALVTYIDLEAQRALGRARACDRAEADCGGTASSDGILTKRRDALPQLALTAATDNVLKLWNLDATECRDCLRQRKAGARSLPASARSRSSHVSSGRGQPGRAPCCASVDILPPFQSFPGHLATPFKLFVCGDVVVSVSAAEVFLWGFQHQELEALAGQLVPLQFPQFLPPLCCPSEAPPEGEITAAVSGPSQAPASSPSRRLWRKPDSAQARPARPSSALVNSVEFTAADGSELRPHAPADETPQSAAVRSVSASSAAAQSYSQSSRRPAALPPSAGAAASADAHQKPAKIQSEMPGSKPLPPSLHTPHTAESVALAPGALDCNVQHVVVEPGDSDRHLQLRHIIGTTLTTCRGGCIWKPQHGLLCRAVGAWVLVERLDVRSRYDAKGRCFGLLSAQSAASSCSGAFNDAPDRLWRRRSAPLASRAASVSAGHPRVSSGRANSVGVSSAHASSSRQSVGASSGPTRSLAGVSGVAPRGSSFPLLGSANASRRWGGKQGSGKARCSFDVEEAGATRTRFGLCGDPRLNDILTMAINQKGTLLATIHASRVPLDVTRDEVSEKDELEEGERRDDKLLAVWHLGDCKVSRVTTLPRRWYCEPGDDEANGGKARCPALVFCGKDYLVVASASSRPHLDVFLVDDFLKVVTRVRHALSSPCCGPTPVAGTEVEAPVVRLLTSARADDIEVVYVAPRSAIFWKIAPTHSLHEDVFECLGDAAEAGRDRQALECQSHACLSRPFAPTEERRTLRAEHGVALHFQFADSPWRMREDPHLCYTTGCLTRRGSSTPTLLLLATNAGFVYGVNFDTNTLLFELQVATSEPINCISCDRAHDLFCGLGTSLKRWSVNLASLLTSGDTGGGLPPRPSGLAFVDLRGAGASAAFQLDGVVKTMQCDLQATEAVVSTSANTIWYLQWKQKARVRLESGHTGVIRHICSPYALRPLCSRRTGHPIGSGSNEAHPSVLRSLSAGESPTSCSGIFATAGDDLTIRLWSCWPRPQQIALFCLKQECRGLGFIQPHVLAALFDNGCLRLVDVTSFRIVGRLQATVEQDPPTSFTCVNENHALVATQSGNVLSIHLVTERRRSASPAPPPRDGAQSNQKMVKHASVSNITALLFGNVASAPPTLPCGELTELSGHSTVPPPVTHIAVCRQASTPNPRGESVITRELESVPQLTRVAVSTNRGVCAISAYGSASSLSHPAWMTDHSFVVKVPPGGSLDLPHISDGVAWVQAAFAANNMVVICRGSAVFLVEIGTRKARRRL